MADQTAEREPVTFGAEFVTDPASAYERLRHQGPVHRAITPDGSPAWLVTRYADVRAGLADERLSVDKANSKSGYRGFSLPEALDANLLNRDPPDHTRLRRLIGTAFTPRRIEGFRPRVRAITDELLDGLDGADHTDLMTSLFVPLPITVICELLGVDARSRPDFRAWTDAMLAPDPQRPEQAKEALGALYEFLLELIAAKRAEPGADVLSTLVSARDEDEHLSENELIAAAFLVLFAGYENTVNLLGNGTAALLAHPEQLAALRAEPERIPHAVEELLRFDPPPQLAIRRFALGDVDIGGVTIPAGDTVLLSLVSAHHDPDVFADAEELDVSRGDNPHLGFGHGPHFCLGAALARMEAEIALTGLLHRHPGLSPAVDPAELEWRRSYRNRGLKHLPVNLRT